MTSLGDAVSTVYTNKQFETQYVAKVAQLLEQKPFDRGPAHATTDDSMSKTMELLYVTEFFKVDREPSAWQETVKPNLPWAEDHFQERIGGEPLNPAPSEAWWPFARQGNAEHKKGQIFSHTYPERFYPRFANEGGKMLHSERIATVPHVGIRFEYGDLDDLIHLLNANPRTRQAYLPIWFPEDLNAACHRERVPCSMGYHFLLNPQYDGLDCVYTMRSCDIVRFYRDDIYMAGRLLQHVAEATRQRVGKLVVHIDNLHCFPGDRPFLQNLLPNQKVKLDPRANYDFGAMY